MTNIQAVAALVEQALPMAACLTIVPGVLLGKRLRQKCQAGWLFAVSVVAFIALMVFGQALSSRLAGMLAWTGLSWYWSAFLSIAFLCLVSGIVLATTIGSVPTNGNQGKSE